MTDRHQVLVIFEPVPRWGPLLEREFLQSAEWEVRRCLHAIDLPERIDRPETIGCVLVLDDGEASRSVLRLIPTIASKTALFVIAPPSDAETEWLLREAGAASFLDSSISLAQLVRILRRRLQSGRAGDFAVPPSPNPFRKRPSAQ